jgi:transposase InsO family protein
MFYRVEVRRVSRQKAVQDEPYETRAQARRCVFDYLGVFYNRQRKHSSLGFQSPATLSSGQQRLTGCLQKRGRFTRL